MLYKLLNNLFDETTVVEREETSVVERAKITAIERDDTLAGPVFEGQGVEEEGPSQGTDEDMVL